LLEHTYHISLSANRTEPMMGPQPDPPEPIPDSEVIKLNALAAAYSSHEVQVIAQDVMRAFQSVQAGIWMVRAERATGR
jgi:hypothetical protein